METAPNDVAERQQGHRAPTFSSLGQAAHLSPLVMLQRFTAQDAKPPSARRDIFWAVE